MGDAAVEQSKPGTVVYADALAQTQSVVADVLMVKMTPTDVRMCGCVGEG